MEKRVTQSGGELEQCEKEAIQFPGAIQPQGVLVCLDSESGTILAVSENHALIPALRRDVIDRPIGEIWPELAALCLKGAETFIADDSYVVHQYSYDRTRIVEIEIYQREDHSNPNHLIELERVLVQLHDAHSRETMALVAADAIRRFTGMERVLVYRFDNDGHGEVVAESKVDDWAESFIGFHFPAADIPSQARTLYLTSLSRFIPQRDYDPVPIIPQLDPRSGRPFDLSRSRLRSVSPVHRLYQKNLGVDGAMSLSIINGGRLWGLVVGHHRHGHRVPFPARQQATAIAASLSFRLPILENTAERRARINHASLHATLLERIAGADDFVSPLVSGPITLADLFFASGGAVVIARGETDDEELQEIHTVGLTPDRDSIQAVARACRRRLVDGVFHSDRVASFLPSLSIDAEYASGVLAVAIGEDLRHLLLWFRPEFARTIIWGGATPAQVDQEKAAGNYLPRQSFQRWVEEVRMRSDPWPQWMIDIARSLGTAANDTIFRQMRGIRRMNTMLKEKDEGKSRFLAHMSHELRAPLNAMIGFSDMLKSGELGALNSKQDEAVGCILEASPHLLAVINDILDLSKVEAGKMELQVAAVDLARLAGRIVGLQLGVALAHGVAIESRHQPGLPPLMIDERAARQMLFNLLSNALKFTPKGGTVTVSTQVRMDGGVTLAVADTGIGIPKSQQKEVLEPFHQAHGAKGSDHTGTGLGLPIVKALIELHGGALRLESEEGRGTVISLEFPPAATLPGPRGATARLVLRAATVQAHAALEVAPIFRRLFADDFAGEELADLLDRMTSIYRPLENRLAESEAARTLAYRHRLPLLLDGLAALGAKPIRRDRAIPALNGDAECWGALYVIEGSTLGGQVIHRQLTPRHPPEALAFFLPHGQQAGEKWPRFETELEKALVTPNALENAKATAIETFGLFHQALTT